MIEDAELLRRYAEDRAEPAFAELVQRHVGVVYAAALRRVGGDAQLAEEVAQTVFTTLARKAGSLAHHPVLIGWLHRSTHYAAIDALRDKLRREQCERVVETETMNAKAEENGDRSVEVDWEEVRPVIDSLLDKLDERDRGALLLRFFEGRAFAEVGAAMRVTEDAARMRVERAMEKLRVALGRRGITSTSAALGGVLANQATAMAPAGFAASVTGAALASAAASAGVGAGAGASAWAAASAGVGASAGAGAWAAFFTMSKIKVGIVGALVAAMAITGVVELRANRELRVEYRGLQRGSGELGQLQNENLRLNGALEKLGAKNPEVGELVRLNGRVSQLKGRPEGVVDAEFKPIADVGRATP